MIRNIIFDLGNVLLAFRPLEYLKDKVGGGELADRLYKEVFLSAEWIELDRGALSDREAIERICLRNPGLEADIEDLLGGWHQLLTPIEENISVLKALKAEKYKTYVLSNFHLSAYEKVTGEYDFFRYFDGAVISAKVNMLKPQAEIFEKLADVFSLEPVESIFIDDMEENVKAAARAGFNTIRCDGSRSLVRELAAFGVVI